MGPGGLHPPSPPGYNHRWRIIVLLRPTRAIRPDPGRATIPGTAGLAVLLANATLTEAEARAGRWEGMLRPFPGADSVDGGATGTVEVTIALEPPEQEEDEYEYVYGDEEDDEEDEGDEDEDEKSASSEEEEEEEKKKKKKKKKKKIKVGANHWSQGRWFEDDMVSNCGEDNCGLSDAWVAMAKAQQDVMQIGDGMVVRFPTSALSGQSVRRTPHQRPTLRRRLQPSPRTVATAAARSCSTRPLWAVVPLRLRGGGDRGSNSGNSGSGSSSSSSSSDSTVVLVVLMTGRSRRSARSSRGPAAHQRQAVAAYADRGALRRVHAHVDAPPKRDVAMVFEAKDLGPPQSHAAAASSKGAAPLATSLWPPGRPIYRDDHHDNGENSSSSAGAGTERSLGTLIVQGAGDINMVPWMHNRTTFAAAAAATTTTAAVITTPNSGLVPTTVVFDGRVVSLDRSRRRAAARR